MEKHVWATTNPQYSSIDLYRSNESRPCLYISISIDTPSIYPTIVIFYYASLCHYTQSMSTRYSYLNYYLILQGYWPVESCNKGEMVESEWRMQQVYILPGQFQNVCRR